MNYDLELNKVIQEIKKQKAKLVCIQLPDGLKPRAKEIKEEVEKNTEADVIIWAGSCFGGCDIPAGLEKLGVELLIQWGHSEFVRK